MKASNLSCEDVYKKIGICIIVAFILFALIITNGYTIEISGEPDSYVLPIISIMERGSLIIQPEDLEIARRDFPELYGTTYSFDDLHSSRLYVDELGRWHSYYFGIYSLSCVPATILFKILHLKPIYALSLTNAAWFCSALLVVWNCLKATWKSKVFIILFLILNPVFLYLRWQSAEIMICSLVVMSLVFWSNTDYKRAALFVSIAGMLNPTIMMLGVGILLSYFYSLWSEEHSVVKIILCQWKSIIWTGMHFVPCLVPFAYNLFYLGRLSPTAGMGTLEGLFSRFLMYLFDLNTGFLAYFPLAFLVVLPVMIWAILTKRDIRSVWYGIAFFGSILAFSLASHINCGMQGLPRYLAWSFPMLGFYLILECPRMISAEKGKKWIASVMLLSPAISGIIVVISMNTMYIEFTPMAETLLNYVPSLYNPYYATFVSRTNHIDGGYEYEEPVVYTNSKGEIRKILIKPTMISQLSNMVVGASEDTTDFVDMLNNLDSTKENIYINIPSSTKLMLAKDFPISLNFATGTPLPTNSKGIYGNEGTMCWIGPDATMTLQVGNKKQTGLSIQYSVNDALYIRGGRKARNRC